MTLSHPDTRGIHDLGGVLNEPFNEDEHDYDPWEKRTHALRELLARKGLLKVDELRRAVEELGEEKYKRLTYYEQWIWAMSQIMIERGLVTDDAMGRKIAEVETRYQGQDNG
ncbi:MAG: ScnB-like protein [Paracoccaceae bacterium]